MSYESTHSTTVALAIAALVVVSGTAVAASAVEVTNLTNSDVESGQTVSHTLEFETDNVSADGNVDQIYVELPNEYAGNASFSTASFQNRSSGATVPISSSTSVVDGPDDDGVMDTLRTGISNDADYPADDINATYQFDLTHPVVSETTNYDVTITVNDSESATASTTATDAIVVESSGETATDTETPTATDTPTETESMDTDTESMTTESATESMMTESATEQEMTESSTDASGPGFTGGLAVVALAAVALLAGRRL